MPSEPPFVARAIPPPVMGIVTDSEAEGDPPVNIDNFVIAMRRDREAAHRARAAAGKAPRTAPATPRATAAPATRSAER